MICFTAAGVRISLDFTFFGALGIFFAFDQSGYGIFCLLACLCHESAHLAVMLAEGQLPREIIFSGGGICIKQREKPSVFALFAGCGANLLLFFVFYVFSDNKSLYGAMFGAANLCICALNLLPIGELDGKKLLDRLLFRFLSPLSAEKLSGGIGLFFSLALGIGLLLLFILGNISAAAVLIMLYMTVINLF